jgi:hypothetical protein
MKRGGSGYIALSAQFPNVNNVIGYNVNLGKPGLDVSDPSSYVNSRNISGGSNTRRKRLPRKMKGGVSMLTNDAFLGSANNMSSFSGFGSTAGSFFSQAKIAADPLQPSSMYSNSNTGSYLV